MGNIHSIWANTWVNVGSWVATIPTDGRMDGFLPSCTLFCCVYVYVYNSIVWSVDKVLSKFFFFVRAKIGKSSLLTRKIATSNLYLPCALPSMLVACILLVYRRKEHKGTCYTTCYYRTNISHYFSIFNMKPLSDTNLKTKRTENQKGTTNNIHTDYIHYSIFQTIPTTKSNSFLFRQSNSIFMKGNVNRNTFACFCVAVVAKKSNCGA